MFASEVGNAIAKAIDVNNPAFQLSILVFDGPQ